MRPEATAQKTYSITLNLPVFTSECKRISMIMKVCRAASSLTVGQLSEMIRVPEATVRWWERDGKIPAYMLGKISDACGQSMDVWRV